MSNGRNKYTVRAVKDGVWWAISVDGLLGAHSQAKRLNKVEATARELIGLLLEVDEESFDIGLEVECQGAIRDALDAFGDAEKMMTEGEELVSSAVASKKSSLDQLRHLGLTVREIGVLLGVSHQRVSALLHSGGKPRDPLRRSDSLA